MKRHLCYAAGMFEDAYEKGCCILPQNEESPYETASNRHTVKAPYCEITTARFLVSLDEKINPRFYRGKEKSFSMKLSEGKQILESKRLNEKEIGKE